MKNVGILIFLAFISGCSFFSESTISTDLAEELVYIAIAQDEGENKNYCLRISGKPPSEKLTTKLNELGMNPLDCPEEPKISIYMQSFEKTIFNRIKATYGYYCGTLCAAEFNCKFKENSEGSFELVECKMLWIS